MYAGKKRRHDGATVGRLEHTGNVRGLTSPQGGHYRLPSPNGQRRSSFSSGFKNTFEARGSPQLVRDTSSPKGASKHHATTKPHGRPLPDRAKHARSPSKSRGENEAIPRVSGSDATAISPGRREELALAQERSKLPIHPHTSPIRRTLNLSRDVLLLVGETGSGKSTQVPQMLLSEPWCKGNIAITQPRRVAAVSLAQRVAKEMGTNLGNASSKSLVGYSVRFDQNVASGTRLKYLTEGMLLQEMLRDPWLTQYSLVIVDEVHERSVNCDLILGFLRRIVTDRAGRRRRREGRPLKVVVMSATAEVEALFDFFAQGYGEKGLPKADAVEQIPSTVPDKQLENCDDDHQLVPQDASNGHRHKKKHKTKHGVAGIIDSINGGHAIAGGLKGGEASGPQATGSRPTEIVSEHISTYYVEGRQHPVETLYLPEPVQEYLDVALDTIFKIHKTEPLPGDILVFLTGQDVIESLETLVNEKAAELPPTMPKIQTLPLFAALPYAEQQAIFSRTPPNTRKIILATNIAETSVTIPGVRFVVDSGLAKIKEFRTSLGLDSLLVKPVSRSAAIQRKGRAGREAPGKCYRLYTEKDYQALHAANTPEILRCDLASAILTMKSRGVADPLNFPLLSRPSDESLKRAFFHLLRIQALNEKGDITRAGKQMARLPLTPALSRVIIAAAEQDAKQDGNDTTHSGPAEVTPSKSLVLAVIDIIAALNAEKIFLPLTTTPSSQDPTTSTISSSGSKPIPKTKDSSSHTPTLTEATLTARLDAQALLRNPKSDHLTLLTTLRSYAAEPSTNRARYALDRNLSHRALKNALQVRTQLRAQAVQCKLLHPVTLAKVEDREKIATGRAQSQGPSGNGSASETIAVDALLAESILRCFLAGFPSNVAVLKRSVAASKPQQRRNRDSNTNNDENGAGSGGGSGMGEYKTIEGGRDVAVHPSSVLFGRKCEAVVFQELVFTGRCWARCVSAVQVDWWADVVGGASQE